MPDAEDGLRRVIEGESVRRRKSEAEPRMQEAAGADKTFARAAAAGALQVIIAS